MKFKLGDKVKCKENYNSNLRLGEIYVIIYLENNIWCKVRESEGFYLIDYRFELVSKSEHVFRKLLL